MSDMTSVVLAEIIFVNKPITTQQLADRLKQPKSKVHKALVELRRADKVQFIGKNLGWIPRG
jgi:predicted transcriptional regulator